MPKLTEAEIKECEAKFGKLPAIQLLYGEYEYQGQTLDQKAVFWRVLGKKTIVESGLPVPKCLAEDAPKVSGSSRDIRDDLRELKKRWPRVRVYAVTTDQKAAAGHVVVPLREETGGTMFLPRHGEWVLVRYQGDNSVGRVQLTPSLQSSPGQTRGIYTDSIGGCSAVAVLYGNREAGLGKAFAIATLAHLPGSDPSRIHWPLMYPSPSSSKGTLHAPGTHVRAVVFADDEDAASRALAALDENLQVRGHFVTVYLSGNLSWCGVDHMGRFGITS